MLMLAGIGKGHMVAGLGQEADGYQARVVMPGIEDIGDKFKRPVIKN